MTTTVLRNMKSLAEQFGVDYQTIWRWTNPKFTASPLPTVKVGKLVFVRETDLEAWLSSRTRG